MSEENEATVAEKDSFNVVKGETNFTMTWDAVKRGDAKGDKFPVLDKEATSIEDLIKFFDGKQAFLVLYTRARQSCKLWYDSVCEKHGGFTEAARAEFNTLVLEGKIARQTKSEVEEQIADVIEEARIWVDRLGNPDYPTAQEEVQQAFKTQANLQKTLDSLSRKKKKDEDED